VLSAVMNLAACFGASQRTLWTFLQGADRTRARRSMATGTSKVGLCLLWQLSVAPLKN